MSGVDICPQRKSGSAPPPEARLGGKKDVKGRKKKCKVNGESQPRRVLLKEICFGGPHSSAPVGMRVLCGLCLDLRKWFGILSLQYT